MVPQPRADMKDVTVVQIGMCTADMPGTLRLYHELFGFVNAGSNVLWGDVMKIQGLGPDARSFIWWMVGGAPFFQLEFFTHTEPKQRPQPKDWRPCDHGWVRFGVAVNDFDRVVTGLKRWKIAPLGATGAKGQRRLAFRDPHIGAIVEVIESTAKTCPTMTYAASSVADIMVARRFYSEIIGAKIEPLENLHKPEDEALWGMANAHREGFLARFGERVFEIVEYTSPKGRPRAKDHMISDQGIMNLALASRDKKVMGDLIDRIKDDGHPPTIVFGGPDMVGTYITDSGCELEIFASPETRDAAMGFAPGPPFLAEFAVK